MKIDRVGEVNKANNGMLMKVIAYRSYDSIDVQFENGIVVNNKSYGDFKKGKINLPKALERVGEVSKAKNGMLIKIIEYRSARDIDVQFEDGVVVKNKSYNDFKEGYIPHPKFSTKVRRNNSNRVGEVNKATNGMMMKVIAYRSGTDIDIQFEDGSIVRNKSYQNFLKGKIGHPLGNLAMKRVGETNIANNGMKMEIINYRSNDDIDVKFENGVVRKNVSYRSFKIGNLGCYPHREPKVFKIGEEKVAKNGMLMKIVGYRKTSDIDVQFEDGTIVQSSYQKFKLGEVKNPTFDKYALRLGDIKISNSGLHMKVVSYRNACDVDVQFEDGAIVTNKYYLSFVKGQIAHPMISKWGISKNFYGFTDIKKSFEYNGMVYYLCKDLQGKGQVYTLQQMMKLAGVEPVF